MNKKLALCIMALVLTTSTGAFAQDKNVRAVFHPTVNVGSGIYGSLWAIANAVPGQDNAHLFIGAGYKADRWWVETLIQRRLKPDPTWNLDFRFGGNRNRLSLYFEPAIFLESRGVYDFLILQYKVWRTLSVGLETENTHQRSGASLGGGPRLNLGIGKFGSVAVAYQNRRDEPDIVRLYMVFAPSF